MADLAVTHKTFGKSYSERGGFELGVCGLLLEGVHDGSVCSGDSVTLLVGGFSNSPAIDDDWTDIRLEFTSRDRGSILKTAFWSTIFTVCGREELEGWNNSLN